MRRQRAVKTRARRHAFKYVQGLLDHVNKKGEWGRRGAWRQKVIDRYQSEIQSSREKAKEHGPEGRAAGHRLARLEPHLAEFTREFEDSSYWRTLLADAAAFSVRWPDLLRLVFSEGFSSFDRPREHWAETDFVSDVGYSLEHSAVYRIRASLRVEEPITIPENAGPLPTLTAARVGEECLASLRKLNVQLDQVNEAGFFPVDPVGIAKCETPECGASMMRFPAYQIAFRELYEHKRLQDLKACGLCGDMFLAKHDRQKYCSRACRWRASNADVTRRVQKNRQNRQSRRALELAQLRAKKRRLEELRAKRLGTRKMPKSVK